MNSPESCALAVVKEVSAVKVIERLRTLPFPKKDAKPRSLLCHLCFAFVLDGDVNQSKAIHELHIVRDGIVGG